ncbi:hypothetical protein [Gilliamella sp. BG6]|nr:hypothetical protein [Gilliamella sp.]
MSNEEQNIAILHATMKARPKKLQPVYEPNQEEKGAPPKPRPQPNPNK